MPATDTKKKAKTMKPVRARPGCTCHIPGPNGKLLPRSDRCTTRWIRCDGAAQANYNKRREEAERLLSAKP